VERDQFLERARERARADSSTARAVGRALSAAVYRFAGRPEGLIHEVWAGREMAPAGRGGALLKEDILGSVTGEMKESVRSTFFAVREFALSKFPHATRDLMEYNYSFKVTKDDEPSGGTSAGLPAALAFLSVFVQKPLAQDVAMTGVVVADSHEVLTVRSVGDVIYKVEAAYHRNLRKIVVPSGDRMQLEQSSRLPRRVLDETARYASSLDEAIPEVFAEPAFGGAPAKPSRGGSRFSGTRPSSCGSAAFVDQKPTPVTGECGWNAKGNVALMRLGSLARTSRY
jgi:hypothetical protein